VAEHGSQLVRQSLANEHPAGPCIARASIVIISISVPSEPYVTSPDSGNALRKSKCQSL